MAKSSNFAERGAPANSRHTKTPQQAEIMVAPETKTPADKTPADKTPADKGARG